MKSPLPKERLRVEHRQREVVGDRIADTSNPVPSAPRRGPAALRIETTRIDAVMM
jgi:hypothetical protein